MSEEQAIKISPSPRTRQSIAANLEGLGLKAGMTVMVHSSLRSLGRACGGPVA